MLASARPACPASAAGRAGFSRNCGDAAARRRRAITPKALASAQRHLDAGHGAARALRHVVGDQLGVVHLVDVVAGQHQDVLGVVRAQDVEVLVHRVGRAAVPASPRPCAAAPAAGR